MSDSDQVRLTRQDRWQVSMDGVVETRASFGVSARGRHYALQVSHLGGDGGIPAWSRPFRTAEQAEHVAGIRSSVALGDRLPSARQEGMERMAQARRGLDLPPTARAAQALAGAALYRQAAAPRAEGDPLSEAGRENLLGTARQHLRQARAINEAARMPSQPVPPALAAEPVSRPTFAPVVITQAMRDAARAVARAAPASASSIVQRQVQVDRASRARL